MGGKRLIPTKTSFRGEKKVPCVYMTACLLQWSNSWVKVFKACCGVFNEGLTLIEREREREEDSLLTVRGGRNILV